MFIVSRSSGMLAPQGKLRSAYPALFTALAAAANLDLRIMVSDIDRTLGAEKCEDTLCPQNKSCAPDDPSYPCSHDYADCDALFGASVIHPIGIGAANVDCGFGPFLTDADQTSLDCALTVGEGTESVSFGGTLQGMLGATNAPCNGGFIRDGAALLMVVLSNKDDSTFTRPPGWVADTMSKRPLDSMAIVALTKNAPKISEFVASFPRTIAEDIDAPSYANVMQDAANLIKEGFCGV